MADHLRETSLRVEVLRILLHVLGEGVDAVGEDRNLYLGRAGVALVDLISLNEGGLCLLGNHRFFTFLIYFSYGNVSAGDNTNHAEEKILWRSRVYDITSHKAEDIIPHLFAIVKWFSKKLKKIFKTP